MDTAALRLDGSGLVVTLRDGSTLAGEALVGVELRLGSGDVTGVIRIDDVAPDPHAHDQSVMLYDVAVQDPASGRWDKLCAADPYGRTTAIAVPGFWDQDGRFACGAGGAFSFACTAGARGKCVRFGYLPWASAPNGDSLAPYHAACVRMVRADYCGDGVPHTVPGVTIQMLIAPASMSRGVPATAPSRRCGDRTARSAWRAPAARSFRSRRSRALARVSPRCRPRPAPRAQSTPCPARCSATALSEAPRAPMIGSPPTRVWISIPPGRAGRTARLRQAA